MSPVMPDSSQFFRAEIAAMEGYEPGEWPPLNSGVLKLNSNENPYPPSLKVLAALQDISGELLRRYPNPRGKTFCEQVSKTFGVPTDWVIAGNGSDDLLTLLIRACAQSDKRSLAYPMPTYVLYRTLAAIQPADVSEIPYGQKRTDWVLPVEQLIEANAAVTLIATPNSPTGHLVPIEDVRQLAAELSGVLVIDEAYVDFAGDEAEFSSLALVREFENVIVLRTLSKGYGLAGLRLGFGIAQPQLLAGLLKVKDSYNVDAIALHLGIAALQDQDYKRDCAQKVISAREVLSEQLRSLDFVVWRSHTNFVLVQPPEPGPNAQTIYETLKECGIMIRYFAEAGLADKLRISVGTSAQNERLLCAMDAISSN